MICFSNCRRRRGFSLVEFLVVIAILVILAGIFVPYFAHVRESDHRVRCADNLRAVMEGLRQYSMLKGSHGKAIHSYPQTISDPKHPGYVAYTGADSLNPFAKDTKVQPNDVTASLWLLVRHGYVDPARFICPSTWQSPDPHYTASYQVPLDHRSNFTDGTRLSYSYASPFSIAPGYNMHEDTHLADFAMLSDKNPGDTRSDSITGPKFDAEPFELAKANSRNHGKVGQNVLYADGHVAWQTTVYCGVGKEDRRDNIFTALSATPVPKVHNPPVEMNGVYGRDIGPAWKDDSYLVPTEGE